MTKKPALTFEKAKSAHERALEELHIAEERFAEAIQEREGIEREKELAAQAVDSAAIDLAASKNREAAQKLFNEATLQMQITAARHEAFNRVVMPLVQSTLTEKRAAENDARDAYAKERLRRLIRDRLIPADREFEKAIRQAEDAFNAALRVRDEIRAAVPIDPLSIKISESNVDPLTPEILVYAFRDSDTANYSGSFLHRIRNIGHFFSWQATKALQKGCSIDEIHAFHFGQQILPPAEMENLPVKKKVLAEA